MGLLRRKKAKTEVAGEKAADTLGKVAPSPNPMTNLILADIALRAGGALLKRGVETGILRQKLGQKKAAKVIKGRGLTQSLVGTVIARLATRSVPGAIVVGGGMLAKTLYDRRRGKAAKAKGMAALEDQAAKAKK